MRLAGLLLCALGSVLVSGHASAGLIDDMLVGGSSSYAWGRMMSSHRNVNGPADFNRDAYQCKRENTHTNVRTSPGVYGPVVNSGQDVDYRMVLECLASRGWRIGN